MVEMTEDEAKVMKKRSSGEYGESKGEARRNKKKEEQ